MSVISITITTSGNQLIAGIPKTISLVANIPSTIFYSLDGSVPTTSSSVYVNPIVMPLPTSGSTIVLNIFATNGVDSSAVITTTYGPDMTEDRLPHAQVIGQQINSNLGPFGSNGPEGQATYVSTANTGVTVNAAGSTIIPSGNFDGAGNPIGGTNLPLEDYKQIYSTTNVNGESGPGIGNLPANVTVVSVAPPPEYSNKSDKLFNPRALVIFQDSSLEDPNDPVQINREFFSLENPEKVRDGALLFNHGLDAPTITGSFVRSFVNSRDNTITYYYYDNSVGRWLISKQPYLASTPVDNLSGMVFGRNRNVYKWVQFARRTLF